MKEFSEEKVNQYETSAHKPYQELGIEREKQWDSWGNVLVEQLDGTKERDSFYSSEKITQRLFTDAIERYLRTEKIDSVTKEVVDFGGAEGLMSDQIATQLGHDMPEMDVRPILLEIDENKLKVAREKYPGLKTVQGDIFNVPLIDNSVDFGVSRMMMQYMPPASEDPSKNTQFTALKEMFRVMKPNSLLQLVYPAVYDSSKNPTGANIIDNLWSMITWHRTYDDKEFPNGQWSLNDKGEPVFSDPSRVRNLVPGKILSDFAERCGFKVIDGEEVSWIEFRITPEAIFDRFGVQNQDRRDLIKELFRFLPRRWGIDAIDWKGEKALRIPITRLALVKLDETKPTAP